MSTHVRLDDALRTSGLLTPAELERAEALARSRDIALPRAAVALGLLAEDQFLEPAADGAQLEVSTPTEEDADPEVVALLPFDELLKQCALPLRREGDDTLVVAFAAPPGAGLLTRLARLSGLTIRPTLASAPRVRRILGRIAGDGGESPSRAATQDPSGVTAFFRHLTSGISLGASEIRFEPGPAALRVRYRRNGSMMEVENAPPAIAPAVASRARMVAGLSAGSAGCQRATQRLKVGGRDRRFEVRLVPTRHGDLVIVRILPYVDLPATLSEWPVTGDAAAWLTDEFVSVGGAPAWVRVVGDDVEVRDGFMAALAAAADGAGLAVTWIGASPPGPWTAVEDAAALRRTTPDLALSTCCEDGVCEAGKEALSETPRVLIASRPRPPLADDGIAFAAEVTCGTRETADRRHVVSVTVASRRPARV